MGIPKGTKRYNLTEYLALELTAEHKSEFYNGEIFAMAGGSPKHSAITANCLRALGNAFDTLGCQAYDSNLMVQIEPLNIVLYPDASVFCEPLTLDPDSQNLVRNPSLILEVLSNSTANYDRGNKFFKYQMIPSLLTYIFVEQNEPTVHVCHKNESGEWKVSNYLGLDAIVELKPFGVSIAMAQIYKWIQFDGK